MAPAMNLCVIPVGSNGSVSFGGVSIELPSEAAAGGWPSAVVGLRPESLELATEGVPATVQVVEELGADAYVFCTAEVGGFETRLVARGDARRVPAQGERVHLRPQAEEAHIFHPESEERIAVRQ